jgi:gas vesicle protein
MNTKIKSGICLLTTLLIGFVIGYLTSTQVKESRVRELRTFGSAEGFKFMMEHMLELDDEQKDAIKPVVDKYAKENFELMKNFRGEFSELMKEFHKELTPHLTPEQIERLNEFGERGREMRGRGESPHYGRRSPNRDYDGDRGSGRGQGGPPESLDW